MSKQMTFLLTCEPRCSFDYCQLGRSAPSTDARPVVSRISPLRALRLARSIEMLNLFVLAMVTMPFGYQCWSAVLVRPPRAYRHKDS